MLADSVWIAPTPPYAFLTDLELVLELSTNPMDSVGMNHNFALMPGAMELAGHYWNITSMAVGFDSQDSCKIAIQGLTLLRQCIKFNNTTEVHLGLMIAEDRTTIEQSLHNLREGFFSAASLTNVLEGLISRVLILRPRDMEAWEDVWQNQYFR